MAVELLFFVLAIPLLLRWHHPWLIATWNSTLLLFFLPGKPPVWMGLAAVSFTISILQYTLNRKMRFLHAPTVVWPLLFLTAVILVTARLTGGLGVRILGGDVYGGKQYFIILAAVVGYFAIINRQIPPKRAGLYVALFFLGSRDPGDRGPAGGAASSLSFLFVFFPVTSLDAFTDQNSVIAQTAVIGARERSGRLGHRVLLRDAGPLWHPGSPGYGEALAVCRVLLVFPGALLGGFRSTLFMLLLTFALLFYLERLHHTWLLLPVIFVLLAGGGVLALFADRLPLAYSAFAGGLAVHPYRSRGEIGRPGFERVAGANVAGSHPAGPAVSPGRQRLCL